MLKIFSSLVYNQSETTFLIIRFERVVLNQQFELRVG